MRRKVVTKKAVIKIKSYTESLRIDKQSFSMSLPSLNQLFYSCYRIPAWYAFDLKIPIGIWNHIMNENTD